MAVAAEIGTRLKAERKRLGLTQTQMVAPSGRSKSAHINWEQGATSPDVVALATFAEAGADILFIVTGRREPARVEAGEPGIADVLRAIVALIPPAARAEMLLDVIAEARRG